MSEQPTATIPYSPEAELALRRSDLYLFFSQALLYPQQPLREGWQRAAAAGQALMGQGAFPLLSLEPPPLKALQQEYQATFTHTTQQDYPAYETAYGICNAFQDSRQLSLIAGFYRSFGLEPKRGERLDHIGVELEFMYFLTYKEAHARQYQDAEKGEVCHYAQRRFLEDHIGQWAFPFFHQLRERAQGYYSRLGVAALEFLAWEGQHLEAQLREAELSLISQDKEPTQCWGCGDEAPL